MSRQDDIHEFWFGDLDPAKPVAADRSKLWFGGDAETDALLRREFLEDIRKAATGDYDAWSATARGSLALILLLDQFPRNIYRKTPDAFATDAKALSICLAGIEAGLDEELGVIERAFFYLPMEHSEVLEIQEQSVASFKTLIDAAPLAHRSMCESYYDYAVRHYDIVARFDRFPHRNEVLGRVSTDEEVEFLKQPGSSF